MGTLCRRGLKPSITLLPWPLQPSCLAGGAGCLAVLPLAPDESPQENQAQLKGCAERICIAAGGASSRASTLPGHPE